MEENEFKHKKFASINQRKSQEEKVEKIKKIGF